MPLIYVQLRTYYREAETDGAYEAYDRLPLDQPDDWGDLASFHDANLLHRQELGLTSGADWGRRASG